MSSYSTNQSGTTLGGTNKDSNCLCQSCMHVPDCACADCKLWEQDPTPEEALEMIERDLRKANEVLEVIRTEGRLSPKTAFLLRDSLDCAFFASGFLQQKEGGFDA